MIVVSLGKKVFNLCAKGINTIRPKGIKCNRATGLKLDTQDWIGTLQKIMISLPVCLSVMS